MSMDEPGCVPIKLSTKAGIGQGVAHGLWSADARVRGSFGRSSPENGFQTAGLSSLTRLVGQEDNYTDCNQHYKKKKKEEWNGIEQKYLLPSNVAGVNIVLSACVWVVIVT